MQDYKLKVEYLSAQFQRMWTRFNLFLTLETGLMAILFLRDAGRLTRLAVPLAIAEAIISGIWFIVGLQDRCLVRVYRAHIQRAASHLADINVVSSEYRYVGETDETLKSMRNDPEERKTWLDRQELRAYFHVTRLVYAFPLIALVAWSTVTVYAAVAA